MKEKKSLEKRNGNSTSGSGNLIKIIGSAALVIGAALVIVSLPDIKRYIKISTM